MHKPTCLFSRTNDCDSLSAVTSVHDVHRLLSCSLCMGCDQIDPTTNCTMSTANAQSTYRHDRLYTVLAGNNKLPNRANGGVRGHGLPRLRHSRYGNINNVYSFLSCYWSSDGSQSSYVVAQPTQSAHLLAAERTAFIGRLSPL